MRIVRKLFRLGARGILKPIQLVLPAILWLCTSCDYLQGRQVFHSRVVDTTRPPAMVLKSKTFLLREPKLLEDDYVYPAGLARQRMVWSVRGEEWRVRLAAAQYSFAGIVFRRPFDFSGNRPGFALMFSVRPADMIPYLSVGLADGSRVMTDKPLSACETGRSFSWTHVIVRLDALGDEGAVIGGAGAESRPPLRPVNWADIREIRVTGLGDGRPDREIEIRDLRFAPVGPPAR